MLSRPARHGRRLGTALVAVLGALAVLVAAVAAPASASKTKVPAALFGLHDASMTSVDETHVGSLRLWDVGVSWRDIEGTDPVTGRYYDFGRLDTLVKQARAAHAEVTLVLGQTPSTYSSDPAHLPMAPTSSGAENPAVTAFRNYVDAVMDRYGNKIAAYQVWNEANVSDYWDGTEKQMAQLTKIVHDARDSFGLHSLVVSASMATRIPGQRHWLNRFAATKVGGKPVWKYVDAVGLSLYPLAEVGKRAGTPEDSMKLLAKARSLLDDAGWPTSMPIWNTEINYGLQTGTLHATKATPISTKLQVANVIRTYVLNAAAGVKRVFWYRWDLPAIKGGSLGNTLLTRPGHYGTVTPAGNAFSRVQTWLKGTLVGHGRKSACTTDRKGTYTCTVRYSGHSTGRIYWNPKQTAKVTVVRSAKKQQDELGHTSRIRGGATLKVGPEPVLVLSRS